LVIWALKKIELYASPSLEMLKALVEKIELRFNRKNLRPIEKIKALLETLYQVHETELLNGTHPFRYQSTETRLSLSHHFSPAIEDAVQKFINAMSKIFKGGFDPRKDFLKSSMQPAYHIVSR
jgi:hypothetical protein